MEERLKKWRLILGNQANPAEDILLDEEMSRIDQVLEALYDTERKGGLGNSSPNINTWLGDIRKYFPKSVVQIIQKDAFERLGLKRMLMEPELLESAEPDVNLAATILSLNKTMPEKTRASAKLVVQKVVEEIEKKIKNPMQEAIKGALSRAVRNRRPKHSEIDWNRTILKNLKNYQQDLNTIIPEHIVGFGKKNQSLKNIILLVDQSGSMAASMVYAGIFGAVMATLRSLKTHMVVFDTAVVDLTDELNDPVELLFSTQLGGGTDINKALIYAEKLIQNPEETILILISDLYEGGNEEEMIKRVASIKASGVSFITLLALNDQGTPSFDKSNAGKLANLDIPSFACSPNQFPDLIAAVIKKENINQWMARNEIVGKG
jgi:Mg-chelatase subunit ChlD